MRKTSLVAKPARSSAGGAVVIDATASTMASRSLPRTSRCLGLHSIRNAASGEGILAQQPYREGPLIEGTQLYTARPSRT